MTSRAWNLSSLAHRFRNDSDFRLGCEKLGRRPHDTAQNRSAADCFQGPRRDVFSFSFASSKDSFFPLPVLSVTPASKGYANGQEPWRLKDLHGFRLVLLLVEAHLEGDLDSPPYRSLWWA